MAFDARWPGMQAFDLFVFGTVFPDFVVGCFIPAIGRCEGAA